MRKFLIGAIAAAACSMAAGIASAATYTVTLFNPQGAQVGSGTFVSAASGSPITSMNVTAGITYSFLSPTLPVLQQVGGVLGIFGSVYAQPFNPSGAAGNFLSFDTAGGALNLLIGNCPFVDCEAIPGGTYAVSAAQAEIPVPAALPLFTTAFVGGAAFLRRRKAA